LMFDIIIPPCIFLPKVLQCKPILSFHQNKYKIYTVNVLNV